MNRSLLTVAITTSLLAACSSEVISDIVQATTSDSSLRELPDRSNARNAASAGLFIEDAHSDGRGSSFDLVEVGFGRAVELWGLNAAGRAVRVAADFAVGPEFRGDGARSRLMTHAVLGVERLYIDANVEDLEPGGGRDAFLRAADAAASGIVPLRDAGLDGRNSASVVPRNAALVLRFNDLVDVSELDGSAPTVLVGSPAIVPHDARIVPDLLHGGVDRRTGRFATTRLIVDLAVRGSELARSHRAIGTSPLGIPAPVGDGPSAELHLATLSTGGAPALTNLSGQPLGVGTGSVDYASPARSIVRPFRSAPSTGPGQGFLGNGIAPRLVARADAQIALAPQLSPMTTDVFLLPRLVFSSPGCADAAQVGDVIRQPGLLAEIIAASGAPNGSVLDNVQVQLIEFPPTWTAASEWETNGVGPAQYDAVYEPSMDGRRVACLVAASPAPLGAPSAPTRGVDPSASFALRFNEPIDPASLVDQDAALIGRSALGATGAVDAREVVVASIDIGADMESIVVTPLLPLTHAQGVPEVYHITPRLGVGAAQDLTGNALFESPGPIAMSIDASASSAETDGFLLRFEDADEFGTGGIDLFGQATRFITTQRVQPRPVVRFTEHVDSSQAIIQQMTPFPAGVQVPLNPLGAKLQTLWRYADVGFGLADPATINLDVEGLSWSPAGGQVIADQFSEFEIRLAHSRWAPDEIVDPASLFPMFQNSGYRPTYDDNVLQGTSAASVHPRTSGYALNPADLTTAPSGQPLFPYPLNRGLAPQDREYYTWRDTTIRERAGAANAGVEPLQYLLVQGLPAPSVPYYRPGQVQTLGLPLLMEFRTWPDAGAMGLNAFHIALATNSSSRPYFRAFSAGGTNTSGSTVLVDPAQETTANGGFNPGATPPGQPTFGRDNSVYIGAADFVVRKSVAHTHWVEAGAASPGRAFEAPHVAIAGGTANAALDVAFRGASAIVYDNGGFYRTDNDSDSNGVVDYLESAVFLDLYGDYYNEVDTGAISGSINHDANAMNPGLTFLGMTDEWQTDVAAIRGARYVQLRLAFRSDVGTGAVPEVSAVGMAWTN